VDLTLNVEEGMPTFPAAWHAVVEVTILGRHGLEGRASRRVTLGTHTGTHVDAPLHFLPDGGGIETLVLESLVGPAVVADVRPKGEGTGVRAADFEPYRADIERTGRVLILTGWLGEHYGRPDYFTGRPHLTQEACEWLLERRVRLVGFDLPDFERPEDSVFGRPAPLHVLFLSAGVVLVESLTNLDALAGRTVRLVALPLKVLGADGAPARVVAEVEEG